MTTSAGGEGEGSSDAGQADAASWPQAPSISRPRVSLTVTEIPRSSRRASNSAATAGSEAVHGQTALRSRAA